MVVDIRLINCDLFVFDNGSGMSVFKVGVIFDSTVKIIGVTFLLSNISVGEVIGVGVRLMDKNDGNIVLGLVALDFDLDVSLLE